MADVQAEIERDIKNTLYTVETDEFLKNIIPEIPKLQESLDNLKSNGIYTGSRWNDFPDKRPNDKSKEKEIYKPFAAILNAIVKTMDPKIIRTDIVYVDCHNTSPKSLEDDMASGRPDGAGAQPDVDITALEIKIKDLEDQVPYKTRAAMKEHQKHAGQYKDELEKLVSVSILNRRCLVNFCLA